MWLYGSGFPKSNDVGLKLDKKNGIDNRTGKTLKNGTAKCDCIVKLANGNHREYFERKASNEWGGWGTQLKPAYEPIIVARKPFKGSLIDNILENRVGAFNIDECRIENTNTDNYDLEKGRFPANVITDGSEEVAKGMPSTTSNYNENGKHETEIHRVNDDILPYGYKQRIDSGFYDSGSAMRYFYCAKATTKDRDEGLEHFERTQISDESIRSNSETARMFNANPAIKKNIHPTVKPVELMQYLVRLVAPKGATILDCFMGSGSTGKAVMFENRERQSHYKFIGIEKTEEYLPIAKARIDYAKNKYVYEEEKEKAEREEKGIQNIFDFMEE